MLNMHSHSKHLLFQMFPEVSGNVPWTPQQMFPYSNSGEFSLHPTSWLNMQFTQHSVKTLGSRKYSLNHKGTLIYWWCDNCIMFPIHWFIYGGLPQDINTTPHIDFISTSAVTASAGNNGQSIVFSLLSEYTYSLLDGINSAVIIVITEISLKLTFFTQLSQFLALSLSC